MIIDADVHIAPREEKGNSIGADKLIDMMDKAGVDCSLTWLQPPYMRRVEPANSYIYKAVCKYPGRILGFGWADPHLGIKQSIDEIKRCLYDYGFYGIKLNGAQNSYYIDDPQLSIPLIEEIAKSGKLLAFHVGADSYDHTHPFRLAKIAENYPEVQILAVHMGGAGLPDLSSAVIEFAERYSNINLIGSNVGAKAVLKAIKTLGAERVCFGSDTPFQLMHVELAKYNALLNDVVTLKEKKLIMGGNIMRLLKLGQKR